MPLPTPSFLLENPSLVRPVAPWCRLMDNLEMGILLLAQPWAAGGGLRRADLERRLARLADELPIGPVYFQRVSRAALALEESGALAGSGGGRSRRFVVTPEGFAALVLNLRVLASDPTLDGGEFELKRTLVAMWNLLAERLMELPEEIVLDQGPEDFLGRVEAVAIWGRQVVTEELVREALDVRQLVSDQRRRVGELRAAAAARLEEGSSQVGMLRQVDLAGLAEQTVGEAGSVLAADSPARQVIETLATRTLPELELEARLRRYDAYLAYLDELAALYSRHLRVADLELFRRRLQGRGGQPA